ncbi:uncharacterized protein [Rutidosis leptorrhynchoides]|uniref:uncharacterized protein n=1 Tax=Rutidosis leptorrhynchoides TaxID=125765 RepID=UPI003A99FD59
MATNSTPIAYDINDVTSPNNPLFLHQQDHPGMILISKKLTGSDNYSSWKRSIMIALNAKNKLKIITGEFTEADVQPLYKALWERTNDMIISWILNTITDQIGNSLNFVNTAADLWKELQENYSQLDGHRIFQLTTAIVDLKQTDCTVEQEPLGTRVVTMVKWFEVVMEGVGGDGGSLLLGDLLTEQE